MHGSTPAPCHIWHPGGTSLFRIPSVFFTPTIDHVLPYALSGPTFRLVGLPFSPPPPLPHFWLSHGSQYFWPFPDLFPAPFLFCHSSTLLTLHVRNSRWKQTFPAGFFSRCSFPVLFSLFRIFLAYPCKQLLFFFPYCKLFPSFPLSRRIPLVWLRVFLLFFFFSFFTSLPLCWQLPSHSPSLLPQFLSFLTHWNRPLEEGVSGPGRKRHRALHLQNCSASFSAQYTSWTGFSLFFDVFSAFPTASSSLFVVVLSALIDRPTCHLPGSWIMELWFSIAQASAFFILLLCRLRPSPAWSLSLRFPKFQPTLKVWTTERNATALWHF